mmetsp:Transcript_13129/g.30190  ORF Transcript_13129/g.30190 Transcript_13129/m.30190 type:complete len:201 (+) Transcript_13129:1464-2066(+)
MPQPVRPHQSEPNIPSWRPLAPALCGRVRGDHRQQGSGWRAAGDQPPAEGSPADEDSAEAVRRRWRRQSRSWHARDGNRRWSGVRSDVSRAGGGAGVGVQRDGSRCQDLLQRPHAERRPQLQLGLADLHQGERCDGPAGHLQQPASARLGRGGARAPRLLGLQGAAGAEPQLLRGVQRASDGHRQVHVGQSRVPRRDGCG